MEVILKSDLRKSALKKRQSVSDIKSVSTRVIQNILNSSDFKSAKNIAIYHPIKNEIDILNLLKVKDKNFYFPRCIDNSGECELEFVKYENNLCLGKYNIMEPLGQAIDPEILDIIYVPALMANKRNFRLGYGKGYYDRFFKKYQNSLKAKKVIVVLSDFITDRFKEEKFDFPLDYIICEK